MLGRKVCVWFVAVALLIGISAVTYAQADVQKNDESKSRAIKQFPHLPLEMYACNVRGLTFVRRTAFPVMPADLMVYKVQPLASKKQVLSDIFGSLPIAASPKTKAILRLLEKTPEPTLQKEEPLRLSIEGWRVEVWDGGQFYIENSELGKRLAKLQKHSPAPTPGQARKAADDFLARLGPLYLPLHFSGVRTGEEIISGAGNKPGDRVVTKLAVTYSAKLDGIPLSHAVSVLVGEGPSVVSVISRLRNVTPYERLPILTPQQAFDKLRAGEYYRASVPSWNAACNVNAVTLSYWQQVLGMDLSHIMPVYVFEGDAVADGKTTEHWNAYVEAVRPEFLEAQTFGSLANRAPSNPVH